ncbi:Na+-translocating NADH-quinone reductase subunit A [Candidatus Scalindua japonica]|uniref:Na+-translocating NADH-quinone reductase subunit A n=1 Tax=Candidatus Scalindua japonica TaxID=1284222 RepID=A0A286TXP0_9BACT|nr:4Fe-4S dicluster domain-containing protein [Candidatus Scalindua japonica]GAX60581.1 Na+-translocating NADH-quinone reductase subunit A [Candidatus Scalindua japonica]
MLYKKGFDLIKAYPTEFSEDIVSVRYSGQTEEFRFTFPEKKVEHIIINLCPSEPWALPHWTVIKGNTTNFLQKLEKVRSVYFPDSECRIVVDRGEDDLINDLIRYGKKREWLHTYSMKPIYPYDAPVLMIKNVLGLKTSFGENTIEHGVLLLEPQSLIGIYEHYILKKDNTVRLIPVSGTGLIENRILKVKTGTPVETVLKKYIRTDIKYRVFFDGPLNGIEVEDLTQSIDWFVKSIVVMEERDYKTPLHFMKSKELHFTTSLMGELRRCVYCNFCDNICPVDLEPALYWHSYSRGEKHKARNYALEKCIECGLCSFICPSKLELLHIIKECKSAC